MMVHPATSMEWMGKKRGMHDGAADKENMEGYDGVDGQAVISIHPSSSAMMIPITCRPPA
jgi:hypothetical protein